MECKKCGKSHGMGILDTLTNHFEPIDICSDCLFYATVTPPETKIILDVNDVYHEKTTEELQREMGKKLLDILQHSWTVDLSKQIEDQGLVAEYGSSENVRFPDESCVSLCDSNENEILCKCGKPAGMALIGRESYIARCKECGLE